MSLPIGWLNDLKIDIDAIADVLDLDAMGLINRDSGYWTGTQYIKTITGVEDFTQNGYPYDIDPNSWLVLQNTGGTISHLPNSRGVRLAIDGQTNSVVERQTKQNFLYTAGSYNEVTYAARIVLQPDRVAMTGIGNADNGIFFKIKNVGGNYVTSVVRRSKASGLVVDEEVTQANWNVDKLDGTGDSGITLDWSKIQMLYIGWSWYGAGSIRLGVTIGDVLYVVHRFEAGNLTSEPILGNPSLPLGASVMADAGAGVVGSDSYIELWGVLFAVLGNDPSRRRGRPRSAERAPFAVTSGNTYHVLSIRPKTTYKTYQNVSWVKLEDFHVFGTAEGFFRLTLNPTITTPAWTDLYAGDASFMEVENAATAYTDVGERIYSGGITSNRGAISVVAPRLKDPITPFSDGSGSNILSIAFQCTGNGNVGATLNFEEVV